MFPTWHYIAIAQSIGQRLETAETAQTKEGEPCKAWIGRIEHWFTPSITCGSLIPLRRKFSNLHGAKCLPRSESARNMPFIVIIATVVIGTFNISGNQYLGSYVYSSQNYASNSIMVTVAAHKRAHRLLAKAHADFRRHPSPQFIAAASMAGKRAVVVNKKNGTGIFAKGMAQKAAYQSMRLRAGIHAPGARDKAWKTTLRKGVGIHAMTHKEHQAAGRKGGPITAHIRWHIGRHIRNPKCALCKKET